VEDREHEDGQGEGLVDDEGEGESLGADQGSEVRSLTLWPEGERHRWRFADHPPEPRKVKPEELLHRRVELGKFGTVTVLKAWHSPSAVASRGRWYLRVLLPDGIEGTVCVGEELPEPLPDDH
jgi:hypothetical protein